MSLSLGKIERSSDFGDESSSTKNILHVPYHFANSADKAALFGAGAFLTVFLTVTDFFTGAVFLTAFGFFAGVGFFAGAVFLVTCKQRHHQHHHREIDNKIYLLIIKKRTFLLTVLAGAGADFFMIALTVTAIVVVVLRALNVKTFFSETKRVKKKERQGRETQNKRSIQNDTSLLYLFFRRLLGVKKIRKNCIERFSSSSHFHFFLSIESEKNAPTKVKKNECQKKIGKAVKQKRKKEKGKGEDPNFLTTTDHPLLQS